MDASRFDYLEIGDASPKARATVKASVDPRTSSPRQAMIAEVIGAYGNQAGQFNAPWGIAVDRSGAIYVSDTYNHRVQKITSDGDVFGFGMKGDEPGRFLFPQGIAVDGIGCIYVSDRSQSAVQRFTSEGRFVLGIGRRGSAISCLEDPTDLALDGFNNLWILDTANGRVQQFSATGRFLSCIGGSPGASGSRVRLNRPHGIAVGSDSMLYVSDTLNRRIVRINPQKSEEQGVFGGDGQEVELQEPSGLALDGNGNVYVTDAAANHVVCITRERGAVVLLDKSPRGTSLNEPRGIAVTPDGANLYVVDSMNHRVLHVVMS